MPLLAYASCTCYYKQLYTVTAAGIITLTRIHWLLPPEAYGCGSTVFCTSAEILLSWQVPLLFDAGKCLVVPSLVMDC
jgi:hypothetical protein